MYQSPVPDLAHLHKLDTMNRFREHLFILASQESADIDGYSDLRDKTDKRGKKALRIFFMSTSFLFPRKRYISDLLHNDFSGLIFVYA